MTKKSDSKWLSLATVPILGQPPSVPPNEVINAPKGSENNMPRLMKRQIDPV